MACSEPRLEESYRTCRRLQRRHDPTYYWATRCLPREVQPAVHALYGFVRGADQIVDGPGRPPAGRAAARGARRLAGRARARAGPRAQRSPRHRRAGRRRAAPRAAAAPAGALHGLDARRLRGARADRLARAARRLHGGQRGDRRARHRPAAGRAGARGGGAPGRRLPADELHPRRADRLGPRPRLPAGAARGRPARAAPPATRVRERIAQEVAPRPRPVRRDRRRGPRAGARDAPRRAHGARGLRPACSTASRATATTCSARGRACARGRPARAAARADERGRSADVLVCGASFAGLAVARELAGAGADVLVVDRYEIGARATSACAAPTPWLHAMGVASAIRRELPAMTFTTPHGTVRYRLPWSWSAFDYRELCAAAVGAVRRRRASSWRRSTGAAGRRSSTPTAATCAAPLVVDAMGWRRVLTEPAPPAARCAAEPRPRGPSRRPRRRRRPRRVGRALARAPRLRLARARRRRGAHRRGLLRPAPARPRAHRRARRPRRRRRPCATRATGSRTACARPPTARSSTSATAPGTASRSRARGSAPRSTSASRPGASCAPCSRARKTRERALADYAAFHDAHAPAFRRALRLQRLVPALPPRVLTLALRALGAAAAGRPRLRLVPRPGPSAAGWHNQRLDGDRLRRARPRPGRRPGLAHRRGPDPGLRQRRGGRPHARDRRAAPVEPLARRAVAQGRDVGQHAARPRAAPGLRRRRAARARRARRPGLPHRRAHLLPQRRPRAAARRTRRCRRSSARSPSARRERPEGSYTVELLDDPPRIGAKVQEEAEEVARAAREETDERVDEEAADVLYHLTVLLHARGRALGRRRGGAQWPSPLSRPALPRRAVARRGARAGARAQPRRRCATRFIDDLETPVTRLPEAARARPAVPRLPAGVRRAGPARRALSLHRRAPAQGRALVAGRRRRPLRAGRRRGRRASARRRSPTRRRSPAARSASSATTSCAPSSRSATPTPTPVGLPDMALMLSDVLVVFDHLKHTITILVNVYADDGDARGRLRRRAGDDRRRRARLLAGPGARASSRRRRARGPTFASNMPREQFEGDGRADRRVRPRRRRLPGRALPALERRPRRRPVLDLPRPARRQPEPVHVLPGLHGLPGRGRLARAAADGHRPPRLDAPDRRHAPARRRRRRGRARSPTSCWPTRRSAPST